MRSLILFIIGLAFGTGFGLLAGGSLETAGHDHASSDHGGHDMAMMDGDAAHDHSAMIDWPAGQLAPQLTLQVLPDGPDSRNLHIIANGFDWTPEQVNNDVQAGSGHAHVYLNGIKVARAYSPWLHLDHFPEGPVTVRVTFNANDHSVWMLDGAPLAIETVTQ